MIASEKMSQEQRQFLMAFSDVWTMSQSVVFYYTDLQLKENKENGTTQKIIEGLSRIAQMHGVGSEFSCQFDSKESFDRDYDSKWHYYWK